MPQEVFFNVLYLLNNLFRIFIIFKFMNIFFNECHASRKIELICYMLFFSINSFLYIFFLIPILNLLNNIILIFLLTFIYNSLFLKKLVAAGIIYISNLSIESIIHYIIKYFGLAEQSEIIVVLIISNIIYYLSVLLFSNFKNLKLNNKISLTYIIIIFSTSFLSICLSVILMFMHHELQPNSIEIILAVAIIMLFNIFIAYIYDILNKEYTEQLEKKLLEQQNNFYLKQLDIMNQSQDNIRFMKHDIKEHFSTLKTMLDNKESVSEHLNKFIESINHSGEYAKSGNIIIDSILNYNMQEAVNKGAAVELDLRIPRELNIEPFDIGTILGNLLNNAIEAISKKADERRINISIYLEKNIIYIDIENTFEGKSKIEDGEYKTVKDDKFNHGYGLRSVKKVLEKYNGEINILNNGYVFTVNAMLYN